MRRFALIVLPALLLATCRRVPAEGQSTSTTHQPVAATRISSPTPAPLPPYEELVHLFDYDRSSRLDVRWQSEERRDGVVLQTLSYLAPDHCRVQADLIHPDGIGPYPAVIYMHRGGANRNQFRDEAALLAGQGVAALLLDSPFDAGCDDSRDLRHGYICTVLLVRRAVDLLETLPQVEADRVAYVGHSFGATWGGVLAGVESRLRKFVLMAGYARISENDSPEVPDLDAVLYVGHARGAAFLFQFAHEDEYIREEEARRYFEAASGERTILWYESTHAGLQEAGQADRLDWLAEQLGFPAP